MHVIDSSYFTEGDRLEVLFDRAAELETLEKKSILPSSLHGKIVAHLFYEPSTRTRLSFETATQKLGGGVITAENAKENSSAAKGETIEDTVRIVGGYADVIVLRHFEKGMAARAAAVSPVPIVNAGDGAGEHPTQALLDLYTIRKELGKIDGLTVALVGDLLYGRTVHSQLPLFAKYKKLHLIFIAPDALKLPEEYKNFLKQKKVGFEETADLSGAAARADIVYMTRIQKERFKDLADYEKVKSSYVFDLKTLAKMKKNGILMHPLPRVNEIVPEVDGDPRAAYFRQAKNGVYVRMALLETVLGTP